MSKISEYRSLLRSLAEWDPFLLASSALPGPRANLELLHAAADEGTEEQFLKWISIDPAQAPGDSPNVFLTICGVVGLGTLLAAGRRDVLPLLRQRAGDPRWRVREAVAMALQRLGAADMDTLLQDMQAWCTGTPYEQRAAAAALCEPALLVRAQHATAVIDLLDQVTQSLTTVANRREEGFRVLRQALGYCWSVAVAALPDYGKAAFARWLDSADPDVRWVLRENLGKKRLMTMDAEWVASTVGRLTTKRG
jgi:hypothetical protein